MHKPHTFSFIQISDNFNSMTLTYGILAMILCQGQVLLYFDSAIHLSIYSIVLNRF